MNHRGFTCSGRKSTSVLIRIQTVRHSDSVPGCCFLLKLILKKQQQQKKNSRRQQKHEQLASKRRSWSWSKPYDTLIVFLNNKVWKKSQHENLPSVHRVKVYLFPLTEPFLLLFQHLYAIVEEGTKTYKKDWLVMCYLTLHLLLLDYSLTVKAANLIFISECASAISSAKEGKSGFIYNLVKS